MLRVKRLLYLNYTFYVSMEWIWPLLCMIVREMNYEVDDKLGTPVAFGSPKCEQFL
jgi:hypothetical protein